MQECDRVSNKESGGLIFETSKIIKISRERGYNRYISKSETLIEFSIILIKREINFTNETIGSKIDA